MVASFGLMLWYISVPGLVAWSVRRIVLLQIHIFCLFALWYHSLFGISMYVIGLYSGFIMWLSFLCICFCFAVLIICLRCCCTSVFGFSMNFSSAICANHFILLSPSLSCTCLSSSLASVLLILVLHLLVLQCHLVQYLLVLRIVLLL